MVLVSSEWLSWLIAAVVTCNLGHGSEIHSATQRGPGIMNLVCRASLQIPDALHKPCACTAPTKNGVCHYWDYMVDASVATSLRVGSYIQMFGIIFEIMDTWPSPEFLWGTLLDWDLMLLGSTHHDWIFEGSSLGYDGACDNRGYAVVVIECWSSFLALQVQTPCGSAIPCYLITGSRASRILRGRECHTPKVTPIMAHSALLEKGLWSVGLAQLHDEVNQRLYRRRPVQGKGIEGLNRLRASRPLLWFLTSFSCSHLLAFADFSPQTLLYLSICI
jgi:hypothetical protein